MNLELHTTKDSKWKALPNPNIREVQGRVFVRKANIWVSFTRYNTKGKTDLVEWSYV